MDDNCGWNPKISNQSRSVSRTSCAYSSTRPMMSAWKYRRRLYWRWVQMESQCRSAQRTSAKIEKRASQKSTHFRVDYWVARFSSSATWLSRVAHLSQPENIATPHHYVFSFITQTLFGPFLPCGAVPIQTCIATVYYHPLPIWWSDKLCWWHYLLCHSHSFLHWTKIPFSLSSWLHVQNAPLWWASLLWNISSIPTNP